MTATTSTEIETYFPTLGRGDAGRDVKAVQQRLNQLGFALTVDGVFGACTEGAVKNFQQRRGLKIDGTVGSMTWKALIPPTLQRDSAGPDVEYLQTILRTIGYALSIDSIFGARTQWGVEKFQKESGLKVDGIVGPLTWKALLSAPAIVGE